jgi:hypothetical protein
VGRLSEYSLKCQAQSAIKTPNLHDQSPYLERGFTFRSKARESIPSFLALISSIVSVCYSHVAACMHSSDQAQSRHLTGTPDSGSCVSTQQA